MKKIILISMLGSMPVFFACKKEVKTQEQPSDLSFVNLNTTVMPFTIQKVKYGKFEMIKFNSWQEFDAIARELQKMSDDYEDKFVSDNFTPGMSDDQYNDLADELKFNDQQIFEVFENTFGIANSYRKTLNSEMEAWLSTDDLDIKAYPKNNTLFSGAELSLINDQQQIMIGNKIYQCLKEGYFVIENDYEKALNEIENAKLIGLSLNIKWWPELKWWFINPPKECVLWKKEGLAHEYEVGSKKTFRSCGIRSLTIYTKTLAELESYHRKNGKWKKYRMDLKVLLQAEVRDNECFAAESGGKTKSKKKAELESNKTFWGTANYDGYSFRAELGSSIFGSFTYAGHNTVYTLQ